MREHTAESDASWYVADGANPDRRYSLLDINQFPPEFGPFGTRQEADEFAQMRPAYYVVNRPRISVTPPAPTEETP